MKALKLSIIALTISLTGLTAYAQKADEVIQKQPDAMGGGKKADELIQKHIDAVGGAKNWDKIKTVKLTGGISQGGMEINMVQTVVNDKGMRLDISVMGQNGYMIITPKEGWMYMPFGGQSKPTQIPMEQLKSEQGKLNFRNTQLVDKSLIAKSSFEGMDTINSAACYKLKITGTDGNNQTCYIDAKNYYLVRTEIKGPDDEDMAITYADFKKQPEGITVPMTMGTSQGELKFKSIEINKAVDEKIFATPAESEGGK